MIIRLFSFDSELDFIKSHVNTLEIRNQGLFVKVVESLVSLSNGEVGEESIIVIEDNKVIEKNVILMVFDILNYDFTDRKILNKLYQHIEKTVKLHEDIRGKHELLLADVQVNINSLIDELSFTCTYNLQPSVMDYLKMISLKIESSNLGIVDKTYLLVDLMPEFLETPIMAFINCKCYYSKEQLEEICNYAQYKKVNILFLEMYHDNRIIKNERKMIIDEDYYEYIEN